MFTSIAVTISMKMRQKHKRMKIRTKLYLLSKKKILKIFCSNRSLFLITQKPFVGITMEYFYPHCLSEKASTNRSANCLYVLFVFVINTKPFCVRQENPSKLPWEYHNAKNFFQQQKLQLFHIK